MPQVTQVTGLTAIQLEKLCQPEKIDETMHLLFALNHWAKARERLFFADRQGLYLVKAALVRYAYELGLVMAKAYIDGREGFGAELSFELAADIAAEGFLWRLEEMAEEPEKTRENAYERVIHQLYTRITGQEHIASSVVEALDLSQVHEFILLRLRELEQEARANGHPIPYNRLTELCIAPSDLLNIQDRRYYDLGDWHSWSELDSCDLRKLDPEGLSLISFEYVSPIARYIFHLPLRLAEAFMPDEQIAQIKSAPWHNRESGEYYGRPITEAESLQHPITSILDRLGVDMLAICPRQLSNKQVFLRAHSRHHSLWANLFCEEADNEEEGSEKLQDYWQTLLKESKGHPNPDICPNCAQPASPVSPSLARLQHWQQAHPGQDLTVSQAIWLLNSQLDKKAFYQHHRPDYRIFHEHGCGTRYWKLETLCRWIYEQEKSVAEV